MFRKKFISTMLTIAILASQFSGLSFIMPVVANAESISPIAEAANIADKYFYNQLDEDGKIFYNFMDEMFFGCDYDKLKEELNKDGGSKFGVNSVEITSQFNDSLKNKLVAYTTGNQDLLNTMGAARDAYMADHAGLFFIDSSNLSLRVTQDANKNLHAFLGIGRTETYINKAFWDYDTKTVKKDELIKALDTVKSALSEAVTQVKAVQAQENQNLKEQQIRKAHDLVIEANSYKLEETIIEENKTKPEDEQGDPWNVRTVYGAFGPKHEIVCEGFARAFKMILDELNVPCVLVYGAYVSSTKYEEHMWNYVLLDDNKWYGVDATWDNTDEIDKDAQVVGGKDKERISAEYFLAGQDKMSLNHLVTGIMSVANYEFKYPEIEASSDKYEITSENAGLRIELDDESYDEEDQVKAGKFKISYFIDLNENGVEDPGERMGYKKAREHGYYMINSMMQYNVPDYNFHDVPKNPNEEGWEYNGYFAYVNEAYASLVDFYEDGTKVGENDEGKENMNSYLSFYNSNCNYIQFGITTDKPVEYYPGIEKNMTDLIKMNTFTGTSNDMIALSDKVYNPNGSHVKAPYIKKASPIQNSTMLIGDSYHCVIEYDEKLTRIPGEELKASVKVENSSNVVANNFTLENFAFDDNNTVTFDFKPSELYADDSVYYTIDMQGLMGETSRKRPMAASYFCAHKCSAYAYKSQGIDWNVYGKPTLMDDVNLDEMTDEENADLAALLKHRMTLVTTTTKPSEEKAMTDFLNNPDTTDASTGENLGVAGEVVKTETYNIKLTLCKMQKIQDGQAVRIMLGFPEGYGPEDAGVTFKAYHYIKDASGNITGVEEIPCMVTELGLVIECRSFSPFTIAAVQGEEKETSKTVLFQTSEGGDVYVSDSEKANKIVFNDEKQEATITVKPKEGYVVDDIVIGEQIVDVNSETSDAVTYTIKYDELKKQNCEAMVAKVAFIPQITKEAEKEAGLDVVAQPISQSSFTMTSEVNPNKKFDEGEEFEVSYKISDIVTPGEEGVSGIGALLSYNREALKCESVTPGEGWKVEYNPEETDGKHNLIATYMIEDGTSTVLKEGQLNQVAFKAKFIVLENEDVTERVSLSHIEGSTGKDTIKAADVTTDVTIEQVPDIIEEKLETTEGATCVVGDEYITKVEPKTTLGDLKKQLTSGTVLPVQFFGHKITKGENGNVVGSDVVELVDDNDIIATGTTVKVGSKHWTIIVGGDLDGNGDLTVNDIVLFKLDYIGEKALEGVFLKAAEMDGVSTDGSTSVNDVVLMILKYNDMDME